MQTQLLRDATRRHPSQTQLLRARWDEVRFLRDTLQAVGVLPIGSPRSTFSMGHTLLAVDVLLVGLLGATSSKGHF